MDASSPHASTTGLAAAQAHAVRFEQLPKEATRLAAQCTPLCLRIRREHGQGDTLGVARE